MDRRMFVTGLGLGLLGIAAPRYGRWYRQGSGLIVPAWELQDQDGHTLATYAEYVCAAGMPLRHDASGLRLLRHGREVARATATDPLRYNYCAVRLSPDPTFLAYGDTAPFVQYWA